MKKFIGLLVLLILSIGLFWFFTRQQTQVFEASTPSTAQATYEGSGTLPVTVKVFDDHIPQISHIEITPDGAYMLVGTLPGAVYIYHNIDGKFVRQIDPFFTVSTAQPGFPPQEAGLTGIIFGADFKTSGDVFLTYAFAKEKRSFRNRVTRVTLTKQGQKVVGKNPVQIFEASTPGTGSHQIQKGVSLMILGKPHIMFPIGEGFVAERALDPKEEAGKLMLMQRDGSDPVGTRPFPETPKIQAIGLRNPPAMARNRETGVISIGDTGPNNFDRLLYGKMIDEEGNNDKQLNFNWDGTEESLQKTANNPYDTEKDMVLYRWAPTETPVNLAFYEHDALPKLDPAQHYLLVTLFGLTGEKVNTPGKKIMLGVVSENTKHSVVWQPFIQRTSDSEGTLGHPLGLAVDPKTKTLYFGDIMEGRIYKAEIERR